jgi:hypothetical protein
MDSLGMPLSGRHFSLPAADGNPQSLS